MELDVKPYLHYYLGTVIWCLDVFLNYPNKFLNLCMINVIQHVGKERGGCKAPTEQPGNAGLSRFTRGLFRKSF